MTNKDLNEFLSQARSYIGRNGAYVCTAKLHLGFLCDWCAYAVSAVMNDCGFIGKYIARIEGGAGSIPRESDGKYGTWFRKGIKKPQPGDLILFRYYRNNYTDKYHADHIGIVEQVSGSSITTLEGNVDATGENWAATSVFKRKVRDVGSNEVYAFYRPFWAADKSASKQEGSTSSEASTPHQEPYRVTVSARNGLNVRSGAGTGYKKLGALSFGTTVSVSRTLNGSDHTWGYMTHGNLQGWIALDYTRRETCEPLKTGDKVRVMRGTKSYGTDITLSDWVFNACFDVMEIRGNRVVIGIDGQVTAAVDAVKLIRL